MDTHKKILLQAISMAKQNIMKLGGGPVACIIAKEGNIVYAGTNHESEDSYDPTAHAEMVAIRETCTTRKTFELMGYDLYCTSEPCPMCLGAIYRACIDNVYYCNTAHQGEDVHFIDDLIYKDLQRKKSQRKIGCKHIYLPEARELYELRKQETPNHPKVDQLIEDEWKRMK